ncbi:MAG TPA: 3'(2'),5'-bisphosphate nucleotidase CysQ [Allosphingosinicella sp.]|nr:3'(2'),5'-bisphosphate nucleotidase CysQ [Allosphingosinicella sp.]
MTDEDLAARLAQEAGDLLLELRSAHSPADPNLGFVADKAANTLILERLRAWRPDDAILSEESPDCLERLANDRVWIIDPLDGTREYTEGRSDWAVHVALAVNNAPTLGAVALPAKKLLFRSDRVEASPSSRERPLMVVSRTRPPPETAAIADMLGAELVPLGSAGAKAMAVVAGEADVYYHSGGQHEWDNCAPVAVAIGAGLHASRVDGRALVYNNANSLVPDLVIAPRELSLRIIAFCHSQIDKEGS